MRKPTDLLAFAYEISCSLISPVARYQRIVSFVIQTGGRCAQPAAQAGVMLILCGELLRSAPAAELVTHEQGVGVGALAMGGSDFSQNWI